MQRWIPVLAVMLGLQLALAAALGLSGDRLTAQKPDTPLLQAEIKSADRLLVRGPLSDEQPTDGTANDSGPVELVKQDGTWVLANYYDAPADASRVKGILDKLAEVKRGYAVATSAGALKRFKVAEDTFERQVVVRQGDEILATLYLGSSPGVRKSHARTAADEAVYAVELTAYELPDQASEWLDKGLLKVDADALKAIEMSQGGDEGSLKLIRAHDEDADGPGKRAWHAEGLAEGEKLNEKQAQALAQAIAELRVDGVLGTEAKSSWQQEQPLLTVSLEKVDGETVLWTLSKPEEGDLHVLKASDQPWYLELEEWNAKPLLEATARDKLVVSEQTAAAENPEGGAAGEQPDSGLGGQPSGASLSEPSVEASSTSDPSQNAD